MKKKHTCGFTLLEIIVSLIIISIFLVMLVSFMQNFVTKSVEPVIQSQNLYYANQVMENIVSEYNYLMATDGEPISSLKDNIGNGQQDNKFGIYNVLQNEVVKINGTEVLKVKIDVEGLVLVNIFSG
jgi:prepilin-type N-terminal cleavage/methylation domain-containing protein